MSSHPFIPQSVNLAWNKLEEYYKLMDELPAYTAAITLNPDCRTEYFKTHWKTKESKKWIAPTKARLREILEKDYDIKKVSDRRQQPPVIAAELDEKDVLQDFLHTHKKQARDEFDRYTKPKDTGFRLPKGQSLFQWWLLNQGSTPRLTQMAYDFLSIPAMSSDCERLFHGAKLTLSPQRQRPIADIIEPIELIDAWLRRGLTNLCIDNDDVESTKSG